ncbi:MAG: amidohydrolase family protein [Phycisphaerales bacterium]
MPTSSRSGLLSSAALLAALAGLALPALAADEKKDDARWSVDDGLTGETKKQTIDTTEGTWISLDVSPDGSEIVLDLLGDIYAMPITGGEPRKITSGVAWDMQPRFSPDGKRIAFTSDRTGKGDKGGDNIWIINADGDEDSLRQITSESFRLLSGPNWHPSGVYIVARKHFTSRRSLGAGEMWMYHVSGVNGGGSGGLQLTTKPTDQKDVNEPIFSPDGKYLYYSEDVSPGSTFQYDKDSNGQIYVVNRLTLEDGESERYITGPGGAVRPTPSPDGSMIAFVRRLDGRSTLFLFDVKTGGVRPVYTELERDMQEAWAIHGVYPAFDWTPDNKSIVLWARGKIRRIDVDSGNASEIPFHIKDTRTVAEPVRFAIDVAPDEFDVRAVRWTAVTPLGDKAVYQALGKIWVKDLPSGEPRRLTSQSDHSELYPSISRDGRSVVYTTWDDQNLGSVRVAPLNGRGGSRTITTEPGHYVEPVFSPDGKTIVYRKFGGGYVTSPLYSHETGVYAVSLDGGEPTLVTDNGENPQFADSSDRVFVERTAYSSDADNRKLVSMKLDGTDEREHFSSAWATRYAVSPDGNWVAFIERFNVHVAPFIDTGRSVTVSPGGSSAPMAKATSKAGEWVQFSGDSKKLHWSLGPTLYTRALADTFTFMAEGGDLPEDAIEETSIGFTAKHDRPNGAIVLTGGTIVTMNDDNEVIEDGAVVIEGNRITQVGKASDVITPRGAHVVDVDGQVILPGFLDMHAHGPQGTEGIIPEQNWVNQAQLAMGVTTVHDPSNDTNTIFAASEMVKAGEIVGPRTFSTGTILYGAAGSFKAEIDSLEDARFHLERMKAIGAWSVKSYNQPRRDQRQQVLAAARDLEMMVVPEGGSTHMHNMTMIVDGHTGIEHTLPVAMIYNDVKDLWKGQPVGYTPTINVAYGGLGGENYWYDKTEVWKNPRVTNFVPMHIVEPRARRRTTAPDSDYNHIQQCKLAKEIYDLGITVQAGGHGQLPGICTHWEMWGFVQGGMTHMEALRSGTMHGARHLGLDRDLGSIESGKLADIVVIQKGKNPTKNIRDTEFIQYTIANGRMYDAATMNRVDATGVQKREPYYFEMPGSGTISAPLNADALNHAGCHGCGRPGVGHSLLQP